MTDNDTREMIEERIEVWKEHADGLYESDSERLQGMARGYRSCARELEWYLKQLEENTMTDEIELGNGETLSERLDKLDLDEEDTVSVEEMRELLLNSNNEEE